MGQKMPLRLRVCRRCTTGAMEVDEAGNEEGSVGDEEAGTTLGLGYTGDGAACATTGMGCRIGVDKGDAGDGDAGGA